MSKHEHSDSHITSPTNERSHSPQPTGHVGTTDEHQSSVSLPLRSSGALVKEVIYDQNADLPVRSIHGGQHSHEE